MKNRLKNIIEAKGSALGSFFAVSTPQILEDLGSTGLDFVIIDCEHGSYDTMPMSDMIQAACASGLVPVVRIADLTHGAMQRALDNGAEGIIIPCLRTLEEFRRVAELGKFPPLGNRGFIKGRGSRFGNADWALGSLESYMENSNEHVLLLPQCETEEALEHIEEIVQIPGIDGIFIGPFDLSIGMGIPAQFDAPAFTAALDRILKACKNAGKLCMTFTTSPKQAKESLAQGFDAVANDLDSVVFARAYKDMVDSIRG